MWSLSKAQSLGQFQKSHVVLCATGLSAAVYMLIRSLSTSSKSKTKRILHSPRQNVAPGAHHLPYPPNPLSGARDVNTPYGSMRVYEWGPENGDRVLLLHGISTPCLSLAEVSKGLVEQNCRVLLFDLFGRGYSDGPDPAQIDYDERLYTDQILFAITSSPVSWSGGFTVVGYSMGGGIAVNFAVALPHLVSRLVLIAPGGLLRTEHLSWRSWLLYTSGLLPERTVEWLVWNRLRGNPAAVPGRSFRPLMRNSSARDGGDPVQGAVRAEIGARKLDVESSTEDSSPAGGFEVQEVETEGPLLIPGNPYSTASTIIAWQVEHSQAFVPSFISSLRHAPIHNQHETWRKLGLQLAERSAKEGSVGAALLILGRDDPIVIADEVASDTREMLGEGQVTIVEIDAGHEMPMTKAKDIVDAIVKHGKV